MTKNNYSKDATLLDYEILDYDTEHSNETGINDGRMRLPTRYDISKYYLRALRNSTARRKEDMDVLDREGNTVEFRKGQKIRRNKGEYGQWKKKAEEDLLDFSDDFDWQITYSFPATLRNPVTKNNVVYGGRNVTFRRLYLILCERFNGGDYFIDEYFDTVYPFTIKPEVDEKLDEIKEDLLDVANAELDSKSSRKKIREYEKFAREWEDNEGIEIADIIKDDIIKCIASGQLPCQFANVPAKSTVYQRLKAGLSPLPWFSATEQLIRSIQLFVTIRGNKKWETQSGLLV